MDSEVVAVLGTLAGGTLTYIFQSRMAAMQRRHEVADRSRRERLEAAAALPAALVAYRHAQIARRMHTLLTGESSETLSREARGARAQAWSALYHLELLIEDDQIRTAAYGLMAQIKDLKIINEPNRLDEAGAEVHQAIQRFIQLARRRLAFTDERG